MLSGPAMLLKSFGIEPDKILGDVQQFGKVMLKMQQDIEAIKNHLGIPAQLPEVTEKEK